MKKRNFKVGQVYVFKGKTFKITGIQGNTILTEGFGVNPNNVPYMAVGSVRYNECKLVQNANVEFGISIEFENGNTKARLMKHGKVVKEAEAKLHPEDEFDMKIGASLCIERLFEKKKEEFKPFLTHWNGEETEHMGYIGKETNLIDIAGKRLKVGDVVRMFDLNNNHEYDESIVVECNENFEVMGLFAIKNLKGIYVGNVAILKADDYKLEDGDSIRTVNIHLKEGKE